MAESGDQNHEGEKKEGFIARKFREARERKIAKYEDVGRIYEAMKNPKLADVYAKWVNDADFVANAMSLGREKPRLRTLLTKAVGRLSGVVAATVVAPTDLIIDAISYLPRKLTILGHLLPTKMLSKATMGFSERLKDSALLAGGVGLGIKGGIEVAKVPKKIVQEPIKYAAKGIVIGASEVVKSAASGFPEVRAPIVALKRKAERIAGNILHPQRA